MKIAKFQRIGHQDWFAVWEQRADGTDPMIDSYVRVSEYLDIDFPPRPGEEIVPAQMAALDNAEAELRMKFTEKLNEIAEQRAKLKALTHQPEPREPDGEFFRGPEYAASVAESQDWIRRNLK